MRESAMLCMKIDRILTKITIILRNTMRTKPEDFMVLIGNFSKEHASLFLFKRVLPKLMCKNYFSLITYILLI